MTRKKGVSDNVGAKKKKALGPSRFEFKYAKPKHQVLGQRVKKMAGMPGASRKRAEETRKSHLLPQIRAFGKANQMVDKRLGERAAGLTREERQTQRLAWAKRKELKRAKKFGLQDEEEELTHFGQSLATVQKYERPVDSDDEEDRRGMSSDFVAAAHFGGGGEQMGEDGKPLSRKELISLAIAKSKQAKAERSKEREELNEATDTLDETLRDTQIQAALKTLMGKKEEPRVEGKDKSYDVLYRTLGTDNRGGGVAGTKLPSPAEAARKAKEKEEELERARQARMEGKSAAMEKPREIRGTATGVTVILPPRGTHISADEDPADALPPPEPEQDNEAFELTYDEHGKPSLPEPKKKKRKVTFEDMPLQASTSHKILGESSSTIPSVYAEFKSLCEESENLEELLAALVQANHPSLRPGNKDKLKVLFSLCLRHYDALSFALPGSPASTLAHLEVLANHIHQFAQKEPNFVAKCFLQLIGKHRSRFSASPTASPGLNFLLLLRLARTIFPASDYSHPVVTPLLALAHHRLLHAKANTPVGKCLGLIGELLPCLSLSRRYSSEISAFLLSVLGRPILPGVGRGKREGSDAALSIPALFHKGGTKPTWWSVVRTAVELSREALKLWSHLASFPEIAESFTKALDGLGPGPEGVAAAVTGLRNELAAAVSGHRRAPLRIEAAPQLPEFQLLEPRVESSFNPERAKKLSGRQKLKRELKAETRGTIRELRRDNTFIASQTQAQDKEKVTSSTSWSRGWSRRSTRSGRRS